MERKWFNLKSLVASRASHLMLLGAVFFAHFPGFSWVSANTANAGDLGSSTAATGASWGKFQILDSPQIRLTFLIQAAYLESLEKELDQQPKLSRFLMDKLSLDVSERKLAIEEYRKWWLNWEHGHIRKLKARPIETQVSSQFLRQAFEQEIQNEPQSSARRKRMLYIQMMLKSGFHDFTLAGFRAIENLEAEKDLTLRLIGLAEALGPMTRDEQRLEALASLSNLLLMISKSEDVSQENRNRLRPHAVRLSEKVDKALRDADSIDISSPAALLGGGVFFRTAGQLALKSPVMMKILSRWKQTSTVGKSVVASIAGHAAILSSVQQPRVSPVDGDVESPSSKIGISESAKAALKSPLAPPNDSISLDAARSLARSIVHLESNFRSASKYAELFAYGERLLWKDEIIDFTLRGLVTSDFIKRRDEIGKRFDRYMTKRRLSVADPAALAMLKAFADEHIPAHQDGQALVLLSTLRPALRGNCVSRALALTALFYPAYLRYENPDLKFGLMLWENHIEAVLLNTKTKTAMSIYSMTPMNLKDSPSVISPKVFAASFLYRSASPQLFGGGRSLPDGEFELYPRSRMVLAKSLATQVEGPKDLTNSKIDRDPNPSPFVSFLYSDRLLVGDRKAQLDSRLSVDPSSGGLADIRNLMSALITSGSSDELLSKANQTVGFRMQTKAVRQVDQDPFTTMLSSNEFGRLVPTRTTTRMPILFLRADEWFFGESAGVFLRRLATPYKTALDVEVLFRKEVKELQENSMWKKMFLGEVRKIDEVTGDVDFQFELQDFSDIVTRLEGLNVSRRSVDVQEYPFRYGVQDLLEVLGATDELSLVRKTALGLLGPITGDKSGRGLFEYLRKTNGMKNSDRVRHIQGLYVLHLLNGTTERLAPLFRQIEFKVFKENRPTASPLESVSVPKSSMSGSKPLIVTLQTLSSGQVSKKETRLQTYIEPETAFLLLHYFGDAIADSSHLIQQIADNSEYRTIVQKFGSKFFGWMPAVDVHNSWQNQLSEAWVDRSQNACNSPTTSVSQKLSSRSKSCELLSNLASELIFDEVAEKFDRPGI